MRYLRVREAAAHLRKTVPAAYPVRIRTARLANSDGDTQLLVRTRTKEQFFQITIGAHVKCPHCRINCLEHEWAHCRAWNARHWSDDVTFDEFHGPEWGVALAEVHRALATIESD